MPRPQMPGFGRSGSRRRFLGGALCAAVTAVAAACGSSTTTSTSTPTGHGSGPVDVLYAGSLVSVMTKQLGPAFDTATGYSFTGFSAGSDALATEIKGKTRVGDVFVSASAKVDHELEGAANGSWISWYATFATSKLVLGYNPGSKFATQLETEPWYQVIGQGGFLIGRTDPTTDPKGKLAVEALKSAATAHREPGLAALSTSTANVFPEETLVGRLQAGQLDAGFFYTAEAAAANIATVPLTGTKLKATYTVSVLNRAPHGPGGVAFVQFLLSPQGRAALRTDGFKLETPAKVSGGGVPPTLNPLLKATAS